jgi:thiol:disulfide interchange protein DsbC
MRREISSKTLSPPDIKIINVKSSPSKGLWEVYLESGVKKGFLYVDFARKHFFMGSPTSIKERKNSTQERFAELNKLDLSQIPLNDALVMGDPKARIRVISFHDLD